MTEQPAAESAARSSAYVGQRPTSELWDRIVAAPSNCVAYADILEEIITAAGDRVYSTSPAVIHKCIMHCAGGGKAKSLHTFRKHFDNILSGSDEVKEVWKDTWVPLIQFASLGHVDALKVYVEIYGTGHLLQQYKDGRNTAHFAAEKGQLSFLKEMARLGCDAAFGQAAKDGSVAADFARKRGHEEVVSYLRDLGYPLKLEKHNDTHMQVS